MDIPGVVIVFSFSPAKICIFSDCWVIKTCFSYKDISLKYININIFITFAVWLKLGLCMNCLDMRLGVYVKGIRKNVNPNGER